MALPYYARKTVHTVAYPMIDDHGTEVPDTTAEPILVEIRGCSWQPSDGAEVLDHRDAISYNGRLYCPPAAPITGTSVVRVDDLDYAVVGEPARWSTGLPQDHLAVVLKRWEG